jgi:type IV secretory pathway VirJ component
MEDRFPVSVINATGSKKLIFYFSGDGGINNFTENLCDQLGSKGYTVIRFNSRKYFWSQKTPEQIAKDAGEIITYYLSLYNKKDFALVGYSFGADAVVYLTNRLPKNLQPKLVSVSLLSPSLATDFSIKFSDLLGIENNKGAYQTLPEINKINIPVLCIFGDEEDKAFYNAIASKKNIRRILLPGSHKFNNDVSMVVNILLTAL